MMYSIEIPTKLILFFQDIYRQDCQSQAIHQLRLLHQQFYFHKVYNAVINPMWNGKFHSSEYTEFIYNPGKYNLVDCGRVWIRVIPIIL